MIGWTTDTVTPNASRALHYTLLWGLDGVVLRTIGGARVPAINEGPVRRRLGADEVPVLALDPGLFEGSAADRAIWMNEVAAFDDVAAFCRRFDVSRVLTGALASGSADRALAVDALRSLGDAALRAGLRLAVRNEFGTAVATGAALADLLEAVGHASVRADWRPFDARLAGEDAAEGLDALGSARVSCVTVRDETPGGEPAIVGEGQVDWEAQWAALYGAGWAGDVLLEIRGRPTGTFGLHTASAVISAVRRARRRDRP